MTKKTIGTLPPAAVADNLRKVLNNRHGYGFQYSVMKRCLDAEGDLPWRLTVPEYPVALNGQEVHIDFILSQGTHLLVAECKRTTGWTWGFARSRKQRQRPCADYLRIQDGRLNRRVESFGNPNAPYDVCVEFAAQVKDDDESKKQPRAFSDALNQAIRARSGLMENMGAAPELRYGGGAVVPVIFTTAPLAATETELVAADPGGKLPKLEVQHRPWLWFDHNMAPSMRPTNVQYTPFETPGTPNKSDLLRVSLNRDSRRSIAVVNESAIEAFLKELAISLEAAHDPLNIVTGI